MRRRVAWRDERGSAVAENAMTSVVIVAVFLLVCQFAYAAHVRSSLTMAAGLVSSSRAISCTSAP